MAAQKPMVEEGVFGSIHSPPEFIATPHDDWEKAPPVSVRCSGDCLVVQGHQICVDLVKFITYQMVGRQMGMRSRTLNQNIHRQAFVDQMSLFRT